MNNQSIIFRCRIVIVLISLLCFVSCRHLAFKGIPLNGSIEQFEQRAVKKGITKYIDKQKDTIGVISKGEFWCDLYGSVSEKPELIDVTVLATPKSGRVYQVCAQNQSIRYGTDISSDIREYLKRVGLLTELYGAPYYLYFEIDDKDTRIGDDGSLLSQIDTTTPLKPGVYQVSFCPKQGVIEMDLLITSRPASKITMTYIDNRNRQRVSKEEIEAKKEHQRLLLKQL